MRNSLKSYIDKFGMITKVHGNPQWFDGGDSAQRWGYYHVGMKLLDKYGIVVDPMYTDGPNPFEDGLQSLHNGYGVFRRHPDTDRWYGDFDRMSRDQYLPILIGMVLCGAYGVLIKALLNHAILRGMLIMTNSRENGATKDNHGQLKADGKLRDYDKKAPDPTGPNTYSSYFRGLPKWISIWFYPSYLLSDMLLLANGVGRNTDDDKDVLNFVLLAAYADCHWPTPIHRKMKEEVDWDGIEAKMIRYFDETEAPLEQIWIPIIKELAKKENNNEK